VVKGAPLPPEFEQRAAALAVARFGADRARVEEACQAVLTAQARGEKVELLDALVSQRLLTFSQAEVLRHDLHPDIASAPGPVPTLAPRPNGDNGVHPSTNGSGPLAPTSSGYHLRTLGDYRLLRRLGQGGMGSVYLGYEEGAKRQVALKVLSDQLASNQDYVERFYREAKSGAILNHPNIVRCIQVGRDRATGKHYLVMEFVDGPSAHTLLERQGRLSVGDAVHVTLDVARALEHAHSHNIIHRDIKPDNILITLSGVAKLADLGLAKRLDEASHLTALRQGFGSLHYIPYEQAFNAKQADGRSDIYALGATLYHLVTGEVPFPGKGHMEIAEKKIAGVFTPASELNPAVPPVLDHVLSRMLARDPQDRYQLVSELIVDLERADLAAPVPSFADPDRAFQDPLIRARLTTTQPTQLDLEAHVQDPLPDRASLDVWYLRYRNREGRWCKTKMSGPQVLERLADGRLPLEAEACREPQGEFQPVSGFAELRPAEPAAAPPRPRPTTVSPTPEPVSALIVPPDDGGLPRRRLRWSMLIGAGVGIGLLAGTLVGIVRFLAAP
jgi:serine/threonine-protein kinase